MFGAQVKELLVVDPGNVEYQEMAKGLTEVSFLLKPCVERCL